MNRVDPTPVEATPFTDRVMGALVVAPVPTPTRAFLSAIRVGAAHDAVAALWVAWHLGTVRAWHVAPRVRARSFALVLAVATVLGTGSLAAAAADRVVVPQRIQTAPASDPGGAGVDHQGPVNNAQSGADDGDKASTIDDGVPSSTDDDAPDQTDGRDDGANGGNEAPDESDEPDQSEEMDDGANGGGEGQGDPDELGKLDQTDEADDADGVHAGDGEEPDAPDQADDGGDDSSDAGDEADQPEETADRSGG